MARSMTGFGRGEARRGRFAVQAAVRSVNNRGLRVSLSLGERLQAMELDLQRLVRGRVSRGSVSVAVEAEELDATPGYVVDAAVIRYYWEALRGLRQELGLEEPLSLGLLATLPGAVRRRSEPGEIPEDLRLAAREAVEAALEVMVRARETEGRSTWKEVGLLCERIRELVGQVEARVPEMVEAYRVRLSERLGRLLERVESDLREEDLRRELAIYAERSDISEEIARLRGFLDMIQGLGAEEGPVGRRLEFIAQEMFREANTMASKAAGARIAQVALDIKTEVEKLREQAANIE